MRIVVRRSVVLVCGVVLSCAGHPGYRVEVSVPPLRTHVGTLLEEHLTAMGYEVQDVIRRSSSSTRSAVKIRPGPEPGSLLLDWLHVTVTYHRIVTEPWSPESTRGYVIGVRAESFAQGASPEPRRIPTTPGAVADADALIAALEQASAHGASPGSFGTLRN